MDRNNEFNVTVKAETPYLLTIVVGNGQKGTTSYFKLDGTAVHEDVITDEPLGKGSQLAGRKMFFQTMVTDIRPETNWTSVQYYINGTLVGEDEYELTSDRASVNYLTILNFQNNA